MQYGEAFGETMEIQSINGKKNVKRIGWDANYDGNRANLSIDIKKNNKKNKHYNVSLTNKDLEEFLNVPMDNTPLKQRLIQDLNTGMPPAYPPIIEFDMKPLDLRRISTHSHSHKKTKSNSKSHTSKKVNKRHNKRTHRKPRM